MNLACLTHAYPRWEGDVAGAFVERLVLALKARGHGVHVVAPADAGKGGKELRHQVPVTRVRYAPARWETLAYRGSMVAAARSPVGFLAATSLVCRQARVVGRLCREEQLELVHAHWWIPGGVSAWLARRPYVVTVHGTDVALLERSPPARMLARRVLRGAAAVTAVSSYLAGRAAHVAGLDQARILVQPMPLDTRAFTRSSRGGGGGGGGGGIVTVGRLSAQKRIPLLLEAVAQLRATGRGLPLTIVGDGPERPALERRAAELGVADLVRFLGEVPPARIPDVLGDADVFAFPAIGEGLGLAAAEALMLGVPIVATHDGGGITDIVPSNGAGRLVQPDAREFARALRELADSPDSRRLAAEAGAALRRRFDPAAVAERFEGVYRQAVERSRQGHA